MLDPKFRKIEFEDYRNHDLYFQVQINIVVEALSYWRHERKNYEETFDHGDHFLSFNKPDFIKTFFLIEKYALKDDPFTPSEEPGCCAYMQSSHQNYLPLLRNS